LAEAGRRIPVWNTECNDLSDQPGAYDAPLDYSAHGASRRRAVYQFAEILSHLRFGPDHTLGRSVHALWNGTFRTGGEEDALRMLSALRGDLVVSDVGAGDGDLMVAATRARDDERGETVGALVLYNDSAEPLAVELGANGGTPTRCEVLEFSGAHGLRRTDRLLTYGEDGRPALKLGGLEAAVIHFGALAPVVADLEETVFPARTTDRGALWRIGPGEKLSLSVPGLTGSASKLRVVAERVETGEANVVLGGRRVQIPGTDTGPLQIVEIPVPDGAHSVAPVVEVAPGKGGIRLCSLSVVAIGEKPIAP
jgi:hypothetical protein